VLASRNAQHAAELGYAPLHRARPARMVRSMLSFPARSLSLFQILCVQEERLIAKPLHVVKTSYPAVLPRQDRFEMAQGAGFRGGRITRGVGFEKGNSYRRVPAGADAASIYYNFLNLWPFRWE